MDELTPIASQNLRLIIRVFGITDVTVVPAGGAKVVDAGRRAPPGPA